jgi:hypothetical protein
LALFHCAGRGKCGGSSDGDDTSGVGDGIVPIAVAILKKEAAPRKRMVAGESIVDVSDVSMGCSKLSVREISNLLM